MGRGGAGTPPRPTSVHIDASTSCIWVAFLVPEDAPPLYGISDAAAFRRQVVVELRSASARYPEDPVIAALVDGLRQGSEHFARLWERRDVRPVSVLRKTFTHPTVGAITVDCDDLHLAEQDQTLVLYSAPAGSESADALQFLDAIAAVHD
ncbi:hypothetical protein [Curtobacterium oceanosedimentum]|uniref:MmyB family transcriptional regulator n=1 Tax=Curtobacterium oceanosedimentum TaxID=465820 RepID=UPI000AA89612|nr:hypothetical protein [Curtobacterium oceanosedimentum]